MMQLAPAFFVLLKDGAETGGFRPEWLIGVMAAASGLNPMHYDPIGGGQGLASLSPAALRLLGVDVDTYRLLMPHEQLVVILDYMHLLRRKAHLTKWNDAASMALALHLPPLLPLSTLPDSVTDARGNRLSADDFRADIERAAGLDVYGVVYEALCSW